MHTDQIAIEIKNLANTYNFPSLEESNNDAGNRYLTFSLDSNLFIDVGIFADKEAYIRFVEVRDGDYVHYLRLTNFKESGKKRFIVGDAEVDLREVSFPVELLRFLAEIQRRFM